MVWTITSAEDKRYKALKFLHGSLNVPQGLAWSLLYDTKKFVPRGVDWGRVGNVSKEKIM